MLSNAVESFRYAFRRELLALYAAIVVGLEIMEFADTIPLPIAERLIRTLLSLPIYLLGLALVVGGVIGILHRVVTDAR